MHTALKIEAKIYLFIGPQRRLLAIIQFHVDGWEDVDQRNDDDLIIQLGTQSNGNLFVWHYSS